MADDATTRATSAQGSQQTVQVRYEQTDAKYASQFVVNATTEEIIVNFSAGYISDPNSQQTILPVHGRIAMSPAGAARLISTLTQALNNIKTSKQADAQTSDTEANVSQASFPRIN